MEMNIYDKTREECWNEAFYAYGTAWIFENRSFRQRMRLRLLSFLGIVVPLALGGTVASFGLKFKYLDMIIVIAAVLGVIELVGTAWAIIANWQDEYAYSIESATSNYRLSERYKELAEKPPLIDELRIKVALLNTENTIRKNSDIKHAVSDKDKRMGHRAALRQFRRACVACGKIPTSMKSSHCDICGNY